MLKAAFDMNNSQGNEKKRKKGGLKLVLNIRPKNVLHVLSARAKCFFWQNSHS